MCRLRKLHGLPAQIPFGKRKVWHPAYPAKIDRRFGIFKTAQNEDQQIDPQCHRRKGQRKGPKHPTAMCLDVAHTHEPQRQPGRAEPGQCQQAKTNDRNWATNGLTANQPTRTGRRSGPPEHRCARSSDELARHGRAVLERTETLRAKEPLMPQRHGPEMRTCEGLDVKRNPETTYQRPRG